MNWHHGAAALGRTSPVDLLMGKLHCSGSADMENHQTFPSVSKGGCHIPLWSPADVSSWVILWLSEVSASTASRLFPLWDHSRDSAPQNQDPPSPELEPALHQKAN